MASEAPKVARDGTMEVTAKEGMEYLEKESPDIAQKLKEQLKDEHKTENGSGDAPASNGNGTAKVTRDNTMVQTAQEGKEFLEKEGGVNEDAKTRAQEKELSDSVTEDKEATKRPAEEEKDEAEEAKKPKVEENGGEKKEPAPEAEQAKEE